MSQDKMILRIWTPDRQVLKAGTDKIVAEARNGYFCLLPRHIDYLAGLVPGVLTYTDRGTDNFVATGRGILVKCGPEVMVSVRNAIPGDSLEKLEMEVRNKFQRIEEKEEMISIAMNQLEADFIRRFVEMRKQRPGI